MALEKKSEVVLREEVASYKHQLEMLQDDYEERHRLSSSLGSLQQLQQQDRTEQLRLRGELQGARRGVGRRSSLSRSARRRAHSSVDSASRPRDGTGSLSAIGDQMGDVTLEIAETEQKLGEVSALLERQLAKIREEGEQPLLLQAAKGTMTEGNELTVRLGQLNARKAKLEAEREADGRSDSASVDRTSFDAVDTNGDGVVDRQEYDTWRAESEAAAKRDEDRR